MKPGQSTFDERLARINTGRTENASDVVIKRKGMVRTSDRPKRFHLDMLLAGGIMGGLAGVFFAENVGLLFLLSLDYVTLEGLILADYKTAAYICTMVLAPIGFLFSLIFSRKSPRAFHFWLGYGLAAMAANHIELRYWVEFTAIPGFWEYIGNYTAASETVNDAVATQPQF